VGKIVGTLSYATALLMAFAIVEVAAEVAAEVASNFVFDLFENYLWHPPEPAGTAPTPLDLLSQLMIDD
jgi:hypothetical protein